jgi:hypothetical protein
MCNQNVMEDYAARQSMRLAEVAIDQAQLLGPAATNSMFRA